MGQKLSVILREDLHKFYCCRRHKIATQALISAALVSGC